MAWQAPKTDWGSADVPSPDDFNRIEGNIAELKPYIIPSGLISMWSGTVTNIPSGWALCDGNNGTPDLRDRFIMGANSDADVGETGGESEVTLTAAQMPKHNHIGSTNTTGSHIHKVMNVYLGAGSGGWKYRGHEYDGGSVSSRYEDVAHMQPTGDHSHTLTIGNAGSDQPHENKPPYFKLAFIMKL